MSSNRRPCASGRPPYDSAPMGLPVPELAYDSPLFRVALHAAR